MDPEKIWSSSQLPSLPSAAVRLLDLSKQDDVEVNDVVAAIKTEVILSFLGLGVQGCAGNQGGGQGAHV